MELYASIIPDVLDGVGAAYERKDVGEFTLIYRIGQDVFPRVFLADPPDSLRGYPPVGDRRRAAARSALEFVREDSGAHAGLGFRVETPGLLHPVFPDAGAQRLHRLKLPFPLKDEVMIKFGFTYAGFQLELLDAGSRRDVRARRARPSRGPKFEFLEGVGPQKEA